MAEDLLNPYKMKKIHKTIENNEKGLKENLLRNKILFDELHIHEK
jgi:hypothetical protein